MSKFKVIESTYLDPRINLAFEEYFLSSVKENEIICFLWQSENAVVIGRNQNPYQECNMIQIEKDHVQLVRRLSGGGAVYHDLGNLNFSFIAPNHLYDTDQFFDYIICGLKKLGVVAERSGRNDLIAGGRKFSGNAFITEDHASLHHGTLLINADIKKIQNYLTVSHKKLETKGFDSIASRVINLKAINESINKNSILQALLDVFNDNHSVEKVQLPSLDILTEYTNKYESHLWNFGENPKFNIEIEEKFTWGLININMLIEEGLIKEFKAYTDCLETDLLDRLNAKMPDQELSLRAVSQTIDCCFDDLSIAGDIRFLLLKRIFS